MRPFLVGVLGEPIFGLLLSGAFVDAVVLEAEQGLVTFAEMNDWMLVFGLQPLPPAARVRCPV